MIIQLPPTIGFPNPLRVFVRVNLALDAPSFFASPPHAGFAPVLAYLDRGENAHGSLREHLYACTDTDWDPTRIVLWAGDTGSQQEDGIGRLTPAAWIDVAEQPEQETDDPWSDPWANLYNPPILAALLTAMLAEWMRAEWLEPKYCLEAGDVLDQATLDKCWTEAIELARIPPAAP